MPLSLSLPHDVVLLDGRNPPQAKSQHGFLCIESQAGGLIAAFIKANGK
jgi:hypothetical protein